MKIKFLLFLMIVVITAMLLYPPFVVVRSDGEYNMGYAFLLNPPKRAIVNISLLLTQWFFVLLISAPILYLIKNTSRQRASNNEKPLYLRKAIILSLYAFKLFIGFIFVWQIIGLIPVYTWIGNVSAITTDMALAVGIKLFVMGVSWFVYGWMTGYISRTCERYLLPKI